jgi:hypothetical protein
MSYAVVVSMVGLDVVRGITQFALETSSIIGKFSDCVPAVRLDVVLMR